MREFLWEMNFTVTTVNVLKWNQQNIIVNKLHGSGSLSEELFDTDKAYDGNFRR